MEAELRRRDWGIAASPAEADLLVVCGTVDAELAPYLERVWAAMSAPRARIEVAAGDDASPALAAAQRQLASGGVRQREPASAHEPEPAHGHGGHGMGGMSMPAGDRDDEREPPHTEVHHGHGGHDMGGMSMPAGLPLADRADDRDGLKLDRLHVSLGPVLPAWPAGLAVHVALQGDVIQAAEIETLVGSRREPALPFWDEPWLRAAGGARVARGEAARRRAAAHLDSLARLLAVAGWDDAASRVRVLRDAALADAPSSELLPAAERLAQRLRRNRPLRWLTDSLGRLDDDAAAAAGVTGPARHAGGDVTARWERWLTDAVEALRQLDDPAPLREDELEGPRGRLDGRDPPSRALLAILPELLEGAELGGARLIVASLDPDLDELVAAPREVSLL